MTWVLDDGTTTSQTTGDEVGFRFFQVSGRAPNSPAMIWGTPTHPLGLVGESGIIQSITSTLTAGQLLCLDAHTVAADPTPAPHGDDVADLSVPLQIFNPPEPDCSPPNVLYVCGVADYVMCDNLGAEVAFDKMAAIIFAAWADYDEQTDANSWSAAWLKCYINGNDPFNHALTNAVQVLDDFATHEVNRPAGEATLIHFFSSYVSGGAADCANPWSVGGYEVTPVVDTTSTEFNIFLHETGHNFDAAHEVADSSCGDTSAESDLLLNGKYDIMDKDASDQDKERTFSDGGYVNVNAGRNNVCYINRDVARRLGTTQGSC